jgi:FkbH-like protein
LSADEERKNRKIKCVVWDLDNTVWNGILIEDTDIKINRKALEVIKELDNRGILQSIASKNDNDTAMEKLKEFGIEEYFIYPQINWGPKSESVDIIAKSINIGIDTIAFIDDQIFELEEVNYTHPSVLCIDAAKIEEILEMDEMKPVFITEDTKLRRSMYMNDIKRNKIEEKFNGSKEEFLASLNMSLNITEAEEKDLMRVEELTVRTHQLNASGYTYSYEELKGFITSNKYKLLVVELNDKFGTYGKIGLVLLECEDDHWTVKLFIMSCRVMSRGVGSILLNYIMKLAKDNNVKLRAEFVPTDRNKMMYITYKFSGFNEIEKRDNIIIFENSLDIIQKCPEYIKMESSLLKRVVV